MPPWCCPALTLLSPSSASSMAGALAAAASTSSRCCCRVPTSPLSSSPSHQSWSSRCLFSTPREWGCAPPPWSHPGPNGTPLLAMGLGVPLPGEWGWTPGLGWRLGTCTGKLGRVSGGMGLPWGWRGSPAGAHLPTQAVVVWGAGPAVARAAGRVQHAAGDRGAGVPSGPLQRLVHEHRDRHQEPLRQPPLQHAAGTPHGGGPCCPPGRTTTPRGELG